MLARRVTKRRENIRVDVRGVVNLLLLLSLSFYHDYY